MRDRARAAGLAAILAVMLAACGGTDEGASGKSVPVPSPSGTPSPDPLDPVTPPDAGALPPVSELEPVHLADEDDRDGAAVMEWWLAGLSDGGQRVVLWYAQGNACDHESIGILVTEREDEVEIAPLSAYVPLTEGEMCAPVLATPLPGYVDLEEPLGERILLHAATSDHG